MILLPFGLRSILGAKNRIRQGCQECIIVIQTTYRFHDFPPVWAPEPFRSQKSDPRGVPEMFRIVLTKTYGFHDVPSVWAPDPFRSQKSDARGVPEMYRILITKTYRFHASPPVWALEPFRSPKPDPRGEPDMYMIVITKTYGFHDFPMFGLRSFVGAKNRIREGCQKCIGL